MTLVAISKYDLQNPILQRFCAYKSLIYINENFAKQGFVHTPFICFTTSIARLTSFYEGDSWLEISLIDHSERSQSYEARHVSRVVSRWEKTIRAFA